MISFVQYHKAGERSEPKNKANETSRRKKPKVWCKMNSKQNNKLDGSQLDPESRFVSTRLCAALNSGPLGDDDDGDGGDCGSGDDGDDNKNNNNSADDGGGNEDVQRSM